MKKKIAKELRDELLKGLETTPSPSIADFNQIEYISTAKHPFASPIFTMDLDEALRFVECSDIEKLAALSVQELNRLGEILGVEPSIFTQGVDY